MGCFSYLCNECGKGILSNSFRGEQVKLFYIKGGKIVEEMEGEYDSYGSVFIDGTQRKDVKHPLRECKEWKHENDIKKAFHVKWAAQQDKYYKKTFAELGIEDPYPLPPIEYNNDWGIAAVHKRCFKETPTTISENDPDQGWGESFELFADVSYDEIEKS
jgi:hypothetical protein